jgi:hypothetical protein
LEDDICIFVSAVKKKTTGIRASTMDTLRLGARVIIPAVT